MLNCEMIKFPNKSGFVHDGLLFPGNKNGVGIIHIHGSLQNFYCTGFLRTMAKNYQNAGISFLTFNLTCHDSICEGEFLDGKVEYVGGSLSRFETCLGDIEAAIKFLKKRCKKIVLQGHSLGCDRVVYYLLQRKDKTLDGILLSPCDSYRLQKHYLNGMTPEQQANMLKIEGYNDSYLKLLPKSSYGVKQGGDWTYPIPIAREALLSIIKGPSFRLFNLLKPSKYSVPNRILAIIGGQDSLTGIGEKAMFRHLQERMPLLDTKCDSVSDHSFTGRGAWLTKQIIQWIKLEKSERNVLKANRPTKSAGS